VGVFALMLLDVGRTVQGRKVLVIFLIGALGTYLVNLVRVPLIIYLGYLYGYGAIEGFTHEFEAPSSFSHSSPFSGGSP
jgi:exosortase/archaeosortase family protein